MVAGNSMRQYVAESARPLVSMAFIAPLLIIYEMGVILLGPHTLRNGADLWLRDFLELLGFGQYFLLPLLTCGILLAWHHTRADSWSMRGGVLSTMLIESILFALVLYAAAHAQRAVFAQITLQVADPTSSMQTTGTIGRLIGYCGAGIYEELLFRLMLLPAAAAMLRWCGVSWRGSLVWAIVVTSLLFSAAHYQLFTSGGYEFDWYSFSFRFIAGVFFAVLFVLRGFGIAAGAHALYDMLVELI
jgi:membrane protease YdiL (CAAX protease family)